MLTEYDFSSKHLNLYRRFRIRLGELDDGGTFENPFAYYGSASGAIVTLWLLIVNGEVIASVITKKQVYIVSGAEENVYFLKYPVSLGSVESNYAFAAPLLAAAIKKKFNHAFLLGMGGSESRVAKFFAASRFINIDIPFYIKIISWKSLILHNPISGKYLPFKNVPIKNTNRKNSVDNLSLMNVLKFTYNKNYWKFASFGLAKRNTVINAQTPKSKFPFQKYEIKLNQDFIGSILILESTARDHKYFGNLNISTILDMEFDESKITISFLNKLIKKYACDRNIDVILFNSGSNQHKDFCKRAGWFQLKSNFCLSLSPKLASKINHEDIYITRLDGDGPINLGVSFECT